MADLRNELKRRIKGLLARSGYEIRRTTKDLDSMTGGFERLASRLEVGSVIDVGASNGSWSTLARRYFPHARYLLIEAQGDPHGRALARLVQTDPLIQYVIAAAGDHEGTVHFDATDPLGGVASREPTGPNDIVVPMTTIDTEVERRELPPPYLVKLDTHGFEVPILEGAATTLGRTSLLVVESYNFELQPGSLRFHDMCVYLEARGMRCIDLVDVLHRPSDGALWQFDLFFVPTDRPEFRSARYG